jgi:hypothetical protein
MSCSGSHLGITINIKYTKFVKDLPMIDAQFRNSAKNHLKIIFSETAGPIGPKLWWNGLQMVLFENCV